jgi:hypothetical protein
MNRIISRWLFAAAFCTPATTAWSLPDLVTSWTPPGWSYPALPRSVANAAFNSAPLESGALPGNSSNTYYNSSQLNQSATDGAPACFQGLFLDDVAQYFNGPAFYFPGGDVLFLNQGAPAAIKGGRHTLLSRADVFGNVSESNESNNDWARQYIWSGLQLTPSVPVTRTYDPYIFTTGWGPNGNNEGFQGAAVTNYWSIFAVTPANTSAEFDIALCTETPMNIPQQGFGNAVAVSYLSGPATDFVILDRNVAPSGTYYASVYNWAGTANKVVEFDNDKGLLSNPGDSSPFALNSGEIANLHEVYLVAGQRTRIQILRWGGDSDIYMGLFNPSGGYASAAEAVAAATTQGLGSGNDVFVDITAPANDFYGIVVAKPDAQSLGKSLQYSVVISQVPNIRHYAPQGWYGPIVPRTTPDASTFNAPLSPVLTGNQQATWINWSTINQGPGDVPNFWDRLYSDDVAIGDGFFVGATLPEGYFLTWLNTPQGGPGYWFTGGLHHLRVHADIFENAVEFPEWDNDFTDWFVWSPTTLANQVPYVLAPPPRPFPLGYGPYPSCDGFRSPGFPNSFWTAVGMIPLSADDYDVKIHAASTGSKDGFGNNLGWSIDPVFGNSDFCIVNFNVAPVANFDYSVTNYSLSNDDYTIQRADSPYWGQVPAGLSRIGPLTLDGYDCLDIHEFYFLAGVPYYISVNNVAGNVDLGLYLFNGTQPYHTKQTAMLTSNSQGAGGDEHLAPITFATAGFHAVVVAKSNYLDAYPAATYELVFSTGQSVVDAPAVTAAPAEFALSAPRPNPFAGKATIELAVPQGKGKASVGVFDLQGRRIAELANESNPGRHTLTWDGCDSTGREVAAGVYFVRLEAAGIHETKKITLLR